MASSSRRLAQSHALLALVLLWPSLSSPTATSRAPLASFVPPRTKRSAFSCGSRLASFVPSRKKADAAACAGLGGGRTRPTRLERDYRTNPRRTRGAGTTVSLGDVRGGAATDDAHRLEEVIFDEADLVAPVSPSSERPSAPYALQRQNLTENPLIASDISPGGNCLSLSLSLVYLTVMGAKCALPSTLALLVSPKSGLSHPHTSLSRQDVVSRLLTLSTLSIAAGKLVLGPVIDALGGVRCLQITLAALGFCLGAIGTANTCSTLTALACLWIIVDFAFSSCWAACVKTIRDRLPRERWSKEIGRLAVAARSGNALSFAFFAWLLRKAATGAGAPAPGATASTVDASWRWVFRAAAAAQLPPLALLSYFGREGGRPAAGSGGTHTASTSTAAWKDSLAILAQQSCTLEFWLHLISRSIVMVLVSFLLFVPSYMTQCYEMTSAASARVGSMFALGCLLSVSLLAEKTYPSVHANRRTPRRWCSSRRKACAMLAFLSLAAACLALQASFLHNLVDLSPSLGTLLMFLLGFSLAVPFYLPSSMFALKRGGKAGSATIADAFDVCGFGFLALFNGRVARVLDAGVGGGASELLLGRKRAWLPVFLWMFGGAVTAMASLFGAVWLEGEGGDFQGVLRSPSR